MRHGGKRQLLAIGRFDRVHDQAHFHGALFNGLRKIQLGAEILGDLRGEGNHLFGGGGEVQALDLAILVVDDFFTAGEEGVAWKNVAGKERFLVVAGDWILDPAIFAGIQVAQTQAGFRFVASDVENLLAVGREHRAKRTLDLVDEVIFVASLAVPTGDVPSGKLLVVSQGAELGGVVKIFSIGRSDHAHGVGALAPFGGGSGLRLGDLDARTAVDMVHPDFAGADTELRFRNKDVHAVRGPARRSEITVGIFRNLLYAGAVGMHDPDVLAAFAVGNKRDPLSIR